MICDGRDWVVDVRRAKMEISDTLLNAGEGNKIAVAEQFFYGFDGGADQLEEFSVRNEIAFPFFLPGSDGWAGS